MTFIKKQLKGKAGYLGQNFKLKSVVEVKPRQQEQEETRNIAFTAECRKQHIN